MKINMGIKQSMGGIDMIRDWEYQCIMKTICCKDTIYLVQDY